MSNEKTSCGIALIGCGIVGGGTAKLLLDDGDFLLNKVGTQLKLKYVVDKNFDNAKKIGVPDSILTDSYEKALKDDSVHVVIELVGGIGFAKTIIEEALKAKKHVVTANKHLLAKHGRELFGIARKNGVTIAFEASCGGGIPIIRALYDGLMANRVKALYGIVNGTCNYILSKMSIEKSGYDEALLGAQKAGFAEADPTFDVEGIDSSHKISILGSLAFGKHIELDSVKTKGIKGLLGFDVAMGQRLGYVVKLIAQAIDTDDGVYCRVEPAFIAQNHPLAWVNGSFNAISVNASSVGHTLYYGRGAGASPTASAVVADIISIANGSYSKLFESLSIWLDRSPSVNSLDTSTMQRKYYLRFEVMDKPGVLATITSIFGKLGISVASIHQDESLEANPSTHIVMTLHEVKEALVEQAIKEILTLKIVGESYTILPILSEYQEFS